MAAELTRTGEHFELAYEITGSLSEFPSRNEYSFGDMTTFTPCLQTADTIPVSSSEASTMHFKSINGIDERHFEEGIQKVNERLLEGVVSQTGREWIVNAISNIHSKLEIHLQILWICLEDAAEDHQFDVIVAALVPCSRFKDLMASWDPNALAIQVVKGCDDELILDNYLPEALVWMWREVLVTAVARDCNTDSVIDAIVSLGLKDAVFELGLEAESSSHWNEELKEAAARIFNYY